jgi:hypothetical protein
MLLERAEVRSFRTIKHVHVTFTRGLNVIHGDNDVGKSTLMEAIRACLTLRARGTGARYNGMRPRTGGDPEVCVSFSMEDILYTVRKCFGARGTVHLNVRPATGASRDLSGDDAEHELRRVLGVGEEPSRRAADLGILPILWVEQGTSRDLPTLEGQGAVALADRLSAISGEVVGGENGEAIFKVIEEMFNATFTSRGPRAGSVLQIAAESREHALADAQDLDARRLALQTAAERFDDISVRLRSVQTSLPALGTATEVAEHHVQALREHEAARSQLLAQLKVATVVVEQASERHRRRIGDREVVAEARTRLVDCQAANRAALEHLAAHDNGRAPLDAQLNEAATIEARVREEASAAQRRAEQVEARRELAALNEQIARARECNDKVREAAHHVASEPLDEARLSDIERLQREAEVASASLRASATTINLKARAPTELLLDGETLRLAVGESSDRTIATSATLIVEQALEIRIAPGGADLGRVRANAESTQTALDAALLLVGAVSVREARERAASRRESEQARLVATQLLAAAAPDGLAVLEAKREELVACLGHTTEPAEGDLDLAEARRLAAATARGAEDARRTTEQARQQLKVFESLRDRLHADVRVRDEALSGAKHAVERAEASLAASVTALGTDGDLEVAHAEARASRRALEECVAKITDLLTKAAIDEAEDRLRRARSALQSARSEEERLSKDSYRLEVDLQAADVLGLDDRLAAARARLAEADDELGRAAARADALRLLYEMLRDQRAAARKRFLAPLAREIQPLLQVLYPGSLLELDEHFGVARLERVADGSHDFEELGGGSKEQLAILVRLAMARVLGGGGPLPVMLDDAIVFTSQARFARMSKVLLAAASGLQLLVFTCHWDRYRELGPDDLEEARTRDEVASKTAA